jgi:hypothetical protein
VTPSRPRRCLARLRPAHAQGDDLLRSPLSYLAGATGAVPGAAQCDSVDAQCSGESHACGRRDGGEGAEEVGCAGGCGAQGRCEDGACVCPPDVVGASCEHSLLSGTRFLPAVDPRTGAGAAGCRTSLRREALAAELETLLDTRQFPPHWDPEKVRRLPSLQPRRAMPRPVRYQPIRYHPGP